MVIIWISAVFLSWPSLVDVGVSAFVAVAVIVIGNNDDEIRKNAVDVISKKRIGEYSFFTNHSFFMS